MELKFLIAHESRAKVAHTNEDCIVDTVPGEEALDGGNEIYNRIALLGFTDDTGNREIFANLNGFEVELLRNNGPRYVFKPIVLGLVDNMEVGWQAANRRGRRDLELRHSHG